MYFLIFTVIVFLATAFPVLPVSIPLWGPLLVLFVAYWIARSVIRRAQIRPLETEVGQLVALYETSYGALKPARFGDKAQRLIANLGEFVGEGCFQASSQLSDFPGMILGMILGKTVSVASKKLGANHQKTPEQEDIEDQITKLLTGIRNISSQARSSVVGAGLVCVVLVCMAAGEVLPVRRLNAAQSPIDIEEAHEREACTRGESSACLAIGRRLAVSDLSTAQNFFHAACDHGNTDGCFALGQSHQQGRGTSVSEMLALSAYQRGCKKAHGLSCEHLGALYRSSKAVNKDRDGSIQALELAGAADSPAGCTELARMLLDGTTNRAARKRGGELLRRACKGAYTQACVELASYARQHRKATSTAGLVAGHDDSPDNAVQQQAIADEAK